jgi:hypothetical protein
MSETKCCASCQQNKPIDQFQNKVESKAGKTYDPTRRRHIWYGLAKPKCDLCDYIIRNKKRLLTQYQLTQEAFIELWKRAKGCCEICGMKLSLDKLPKTAPNGVNIDHDHNREVNPVRGLTCRSHNWGLGNFQDDVASLQGAIKYLEAYGS